MYTFIVNPHSRSGAGQQMWDEIEVILKERTVTYQVFFTRYQKHASKLVSELCSDGQSHTLVVLGGDGTINEVINGIADFQKLTLAYIPTGSGNDFARSIGLPADPAKALDYILKHEHMMEVDIGVLNYKHQSRRFLVSAGFGLDAAICHEAAISKIKRLLNKLKLGKLTYVVIALHQLFLCKPMNVTLQIDGNKDLHFPNVYFTTLMNQPYEGGGLKFCPKALCNDGFLDLIVVSNFSKLRALCALAFAFFGKHTWFRGVHIFRFRSAKIRASRPLEVHTDGEPIFLQSCAEVCLHPQKLRLITTRR